MIENPPKYLIDWIELDDVTPGKPFIAAAIRGNMHDILVLTPACDDGYYTVTVPGMSGEYDVQRTEIVKVAEACPQKHNGPLGTVVLIRSPIGLYEVRRYRDRYEVRRTEGRRRQVVAVFDADVAVGAQAQYDAAVALAVHKSFTTARVCMLCRKDLADAMGCHVFIYDKKLITKKELICVDCHTEHGGNTFTVAEYEAATTSI